MECEVLSTEYKVWSTKYWVWSAKYGVDGLCYSVYLDNWGDRLWLHFISSDTAKRWVSGKILSVTY